MWNRLFKQLQLEVFNAFPSGMSSQPIGTNPIYPHSIFYLVFRSSFYVVSIVSIIPLVVVELTDAIK